MHTRHPPLNWLRAFEVAARHQSFVAAATELGVTATAISQHVRALERRLSRKLFERGPSGIALTDAGRRYARHLARAFTLIEEAGAALDHRETRSALIIRVPTSFASQWIAPRLDLFRAAWPCIDLSLTALGPDIEQAGSSIDAEIRYGWGDWPRLRRTKLLHDDVFPVAAPELALQLHHPRDVARLELLHVPGYAEDWDCWLAAAGIAGIDTAKGSFFDQSIMAVRAAAAGQGVMLGRSSLIERELRDGVLVRLFPPALTSVGAYWLLATPARSLTTGVAAFRGWLQEMAKAPAPLSLEHVQVD